VCVCVFVCGAAQTRQEGLSSFFNAMDEDGDGQIQASEASRYLTETVGGESFDTPKEIRQGVAHFLEIVDSEDSGQVRFRRYRIC
jgi:Ca2+-binding EF-hand superfamily protein